MLSRSIPTRDLFPSSRLSLICGQACGAAFRLAALVFFILQVTWLFPVRVFAFSVILFYVPFYGQEFHQNWDTPWEHNHEDIKTYYR